MKKVFALWMMWASCDAWTCQQNSNSPNCVRPAPVYAHGDKSTLRSTWSNRRTLRSRVVEFCARGWLRDARRRGTLRIGVLDELNAVDAESCSRIGCPDVVRVSAREVSWGKREDLLRLSWIDAEFVNLHSRVLSKGRHGSMRATVALSAADLDASALWRKQLSTLLKKMLEKYLREPVYDLVLSTEIKDSAVGIAGSYSSRRDGSRASFRLETSLQTTRHGAIALHNVKLELPVRSVVAEAIGELYLSTVDLESPFDVTDIAYEHDRLVATLVTGDHYAASSSFHRSSSPTPERRRNAAKNKRNDKDDNFATGKSRSAAAHSAAAAGQASTTSPYPPTVAALPWPFVFFDLPRTTFVLGDKLPWVFNAKNAAPRVVIVAFACVAALLHVSAVPDHIFALATTPLYTAKEAVFKLAPTLLNAFFKFTALSQSFISALFVAVVPNSVLRPVHNAAKNFLKLCKQVKNLVLPPNTQRPHLSRQKKKRHGRWSFSSKSSKRRGGVDHQQNRAAGNQPQEVVLLVVNDRTKPTFSRVSAASTA